MSERKTTSGPARRGPGGHGGPGGMMMPTEKAKDFKGSLKKLFAYIAAYKPALIMVIMFAICGSIFSIVGPKILSKATTALFQGMMLKLSGKGGIDFFYIGSILLTLLGLYAISSLFNFVMGWLMTGVTQKISLRMRREMSEKIGRMPMKYFESRTVGEVLSRITNDVDTMGMNLNQSASQLITGFATILGILVMMLSINLIMTLTVLLVVPFSGVLMSVIIKHSQKYFKAQQKHLGEINGQVEEVYGGHNVIKAFNREDASREEFAATNGLLYESAWKSQFLSGLMFPIMNVIGNLGYVGVAVVGGLLAVRNAIQVGDIMAFIQYARNFTQPIAQIAQVSNMLQGMAAAAERVFEFLGEEEESASPDSAATQPDVCCNVAFDHVHFGYSADKEIIHDFSSVVKPGQTIAIVGPTGAGKTTMVKLLMRFYDVSAGAVLLDGTDIREYDRRQMRSSFGMVLQDTWLFKGTIMENIRYGKLDATDEEVIAAAKAAHANSFIQTLPGGYSMELNEEADNVSQGQKQLLSIARAILADRPILILDEATSSVDTRTEIRIQKAMAHLRRGRTSFVIAHRLSTIREADNILVMRDGDIVEQGTHEELLAKNGFYAELYNSQFEQVSA
jgi:ATP-binding cassette, subfamily B, multidrug efflux pump